VVTAYDASHTESGYPTTSARRCRSARRRRSSPAVQPGDRATDGELQQHLDRNDHQLAWTFGGGTSTVAALSYAYAAAGTYTVSLTVTGPGGSDTQTRSNYVTASAAAPVAQFTGSPTPAPPANGELQQHLDRNDTSYARPSAMAAPARSRVQAMHTRQPGRIR
jgi:hypothetical protein